MMKPKSIIPRPVGGFTLVELLVVITIIAVLVAVGSLFLSKARSSAERVVSTKNISQLQFANTAYAAENNGRYLKVFAFDDKGGSYVAWCDNADFLAILKGDSATVVNGKVNKTHPPSALDPLAYRSKKKWHDTFSASYGYNREGMSGNGSWGTPSGSTGFGIHDISDPIRTAAFFTATDWIAKYSERYKWQGEAAIEGYQNGKIAYRYKGKALVAYYDGHVGEISPNEMKVIDGNGGSNHIFWRGNAR